MGLIRATTFTRLHLLNGEDLSGKWTFASDGMGGMYPRFEDGSRVVPLSAVAVAIRNELE